MKRVISELMRSKAQCRKTSKALTHTWISKNSMKSEMSDEWLKRSEGKHVETSKAHTHSYPSKNNMKSDMSD